MPPRATGLILQRGPEMQQWKSVVVRIACLSGALLLGSFAPAADYRLLNAAYDVARDVYRDMNPAFIAHWRATHPSDALKIDMSHGGSSKQARAVMDGLAADFVAMNSSLDIDAIAASGLLAKDWARQLPQAASPSWSTIMFIVRKGNPRQVRDWNDLIRPGVGVVVPNPKTSGNGRYSYLAAWEYARRLPGGSDATARAFVARLLYNVPVFDSGGRAATTTFVQRGIGDVLLTFENELRLISAEFKDQQFQIIVPSLSVRADNPVAVVTNVAEKRRTRAVAEEYARFHFTVAGQEIFARHGLRPADPAVLARHASDFPAVNLFTVDQAFGGWAQAQRTHFSDGGIFDQIMEKRR
ncbi:MAG: sulfate ABC transporter substrate-binding protein [Steroidobacteraceae bacterium]